MSPLLLSLLVASLSTLVAGAVGIPAGWWLAKRTSRAARWLNAMLLTPLVLPPTVLGYLLLLSIGRSSSVGQTFEAWTGTTLVFSPYALLLAALVTTLPLVISASRDAFMTVDPYLVHVSQTLGATRAEAFLRVELLCARPLLLSALSLGFAKALGDFGVTLMVAGNLPMSTQTAPLALFEALQTGDAAQATQLGVSLALAAFVVAWIARTPRSVSL